MWTSFQEHRISKIGNIIYSDNWTKFSDCAGNALNRGEAILTALNKAKTQAQPLIKESGKRIASVTDGVGNKALFRYDERGNVAAISDPSYEEFREILYTYDGEGNLREITFADGRKAWYTYGKNHRLETAQDNDGYKVTYTYRQEDGRILKVEECHTATPEKKEIPFTPGQIYAIFDIWFTLPCNW